MNLNTVFIRDINALRELEAGIKNPALLFDDVSLAERTREEKIHIFDLENTSQLRILYAAVDIPSRTPRVFTTNHVEDVIGFNPSEEIKRRIHLVFIDKPLKISIERITRTVKTVTERIIIE